MSLLVNIAMKLISPNIFQLFFHIIIWCLPFLQDLQDQNGFSLPIGPVFMSPKSFAEALVDALSDPSGVKATKIQSFVNLFNIKQNVVIGAYGNRNSDTKAYLDAGIPRDRIFLVNSNSVLRRVSDGKKTSYNNHVVKVNEMYPRINWFTLFQTKSRVCKIDWNTLESTKETKCHYFSQNQVL